MKYSIWTLEAPPETKRVRLSCTQLSAALREEFKLRSIELGMPTVTKMLEPDSDSRTRGSASNSLTLLILLDFKSSTTFGGGRGCDEAVPQLTPMALVSSEKKVEIDSVDSITSDRVGMDNGLREAIFGL